MRTSFFLSVSTALLGLWLAVCPNGAAQTVLLEKKLEEDTIKAVFGPNERHYVHLIVGFGFILGPSSEGLPVRYGVSNYWSIGVLYKYKFNDKWSFGGDIHYRRHWYIIRQDSSNTFPDKTLFEKERYTFPCLNVNAFARLNIEKRRGETVGTFIDLGVGMEVPIDPANRTSSTDLSTGQNVATVRSNLNYTQPVYMTAFLRFGFRRYMVRGGVRLTEIFKQQEVQELQPGVGNIGLPRVTVGIEIGLF